jgi:hypothetical protein
MSHHEVRLRTSGGLTVTDITDSVQDAVREQEITDGLCFVHSPNMSCSVRVNEWERGFFEDFAVMLRRLSAADLYCGDFETDSESTGAAPGHPPSRPYPFLSRLKGQPRGLLPCGLVSEGYAAVERVTHGRRCMIVVDDHGAGEEVLECAPAAVD